MLPIVAYTDKLTVAPGEALTVMASSFGARTYHADLRRIIVERHSPDRRVQDILKVVETFR